MKAYLENSGKVKYTSHRNKNYTIDAGNKVVLNKVVFRVNVVECFSILIIETEDILQL